MHNKKVPKLLLGIAFALVLCVLGLIYAAFQPSFTAKDKIQKLRNNAGFGIIVLSNLSDCNSLIRLADNFGAPIVLWDIDENLMDVIEIFKQWDISENKVFVIVSDWGSDNSIDSKPVAIPDKIGGVIYYHPSRDNFLFPEAFDFPLLISGSANSMRPSHEFSLRFFERLTGSTIIPTGRSVWTFSQNIWLSLTTDAVWGSHLVSDESISYIGRWISQQVNIELPSKVSMDYRLVLWIINSFLLMAFLAVLALRPFAQAIYFGATDSISTSVIDKNAFRFGRFLFVLLSLPIAAIIFLIVRQLRVFSLDTPHQIFLSFVLAGIVTTRVFSRYFHFGMNGKPHHVKAVFSASLLFRASLVAVFVITVETALALSGFWPLAADTTSISKLFFLWLFISIGFFFISKDTMFLSAAVRSDREVTALLLLPFLPVLILPLIFIPIGGLSVTVSLLRSVWMLLCALLYVKISIDLTGSVLFSSCVAALIPIVSLIKQIDC